MIKEIRMAAIEGRNFGKVEDTTQIRKGLEIKIHKNTFNIESDLRNATFKLQYIASLTTTLIRLCKDLEKEGRLTNLFGEPIKWENNYEKEK
jgi:hypothetical protein